jgi:predicted Rossmann fold flavoprotein
VINLFPDEDVSSWLEQQKTQHPKAHLVTVLAWKIPKRLAKKLCEHDLNNPVLEQMNESEIQAVSTKLSAWQLQPQSTEGMRTAEVCLGGVDTSELSSKTFASNKVAGLFFIGESIDVTGHLGGYNFQWAWASGWCAGQYI